MRYLVFAGERVTKKKRKKDSEIVVKAPHKRFSIGHHAETKGAKLSRIKRVFRLFPILMHEWFHHSVLSYFKTVNRKAGKKLTYLFMKLETFEHVDSIIKVFKWVILPATLFYVLGAFFFFRENALDSALLGVLIFFYSNFLPDIPAIFRRKYYRDLGALNKSLPWYKNYALLLFAPLFIALFLCGMQLRWKTIETFHNFKSLTVYVAFLSMISLFAFGNFPIGIGDVTDILSIPFYGLAGYLTHLKVDLCF
jgi:hypothetical protein